MAASASGVDTTVAAGDGCDALAFQQLREQLAAALAEKEQLQQDIATLCEARATRSGGMFSAATGYLLSDQTTSLKQDNSLLRQQLRALTAERDGLREDMAQLRDSKVLSDRGWRDATARAADLDKELSFFRTANARAITDRDTAIFESDQLRACLAAAEDRARELEAALATERSKSTAARAASEAAAEKERSAAAARVREAAGDAAAERSRLKAERAALHEMEEARDKLKVEVLTAQVAKQQAQAAQQLAERKAAAAEERAAAAEERAAAAEGRAAAAEARTRELEASAAELSSQAASAREQAARARAQAAALQKQLNQRGARESDLETTLEQLTAALVAAQAGLKELQQQQAHAWRSQEAAPGASGPAAADSSDEAAAPAADAAPALARVSSASGADGGDAAQQQLPPAPPPSLASSDSLRREHEVLSLRKELEEREAVNAALQDHCRQLKERLADAVREKVQALLLAADAATAGAAASGGAGNGVEHGGREGGVEGEGAGAAALTATRDAAGGGDQSSPKAKVQAKGTTLTHVYARLTSR